jgi:hypothetical protein
MNELSSKPARNDGKQRAWMATILLEALEELRGP